MLENLYKILESRIENSMDIEDILEDIKLLELDLFEDTSATGGPAGSATGAVSSVGSGMGSVVNSQPASLPGVLNGPSFDGSVGSGDISIPYNAMGKRVSHTMGRSHGANTGKKSREKKLDIKHIKKMLKEKPKAGKIKNFGDFNKDSINRVKKIKD